MWNLLNPTPVNVVQVDGSECPMPNAESSQFSAVSQSVAYTFTPKCRVMTGVAFLFTMHDALECKHFNMHTYIVFEHRIISMMRPAYPEHAYLTT